MSANRTVASPVAQPQGDAEQEPAWMPETEQARRVLHERAALLARPESAPGAVVERAPYIRFRLGALEQYGVAYTHVEEIMEADGICPVPGAPGFVVGVRNRRGEMLTLLDLKAFFRPAHDEVYGEEAAIIVVRARGMKAGILVNEVIGNDEYAASELTTALPASGIRELRHLRGIHRGRVAMLDMESLFSDPILDVNQSVDAS